MMALQTYWPFYCGLICGFFKIPGSPKGIEFNAVKEVLLSVKAVKSIHCLHLWALALGQPLVSVHLAIGNGTNRSTGITITSPGGEKNNNAVLCFTD